MRRRPHSMRALFATLQGVRKVLKEGVPSDRTPSRDEETERQQREPGCELRGRSHVSRNSGD